ncbi:uncharacterized protein LACBIDRAFT_297965 [Laccaria bicolor S238N-H82]|uniref:Predicted protein n=1 Tax=Laccaria bicolor (strain S238N-H82 / ATCC MYA-4686) TaxID=486041 RepID=B0DBY4_LACBS|nr:uncharacterized protein LACBIDRAFT_297965 [Laccaria bicolor S238N-H82]EDR07799.1 predicted protein [Laccaria bicolor S238N-H82]|eukprot:XP_001881588.1 predicted protein [Laccaria bicolor S238N-H82]
MLDCIRRASTEGFDPRFYQRSSWRSRARIACRRRHRRRRVISKGIFDSQRQPASDTPRYRTPSGELPNPPVGFGADTSLHLESTPDICALLSTYLASLPEPILLPTLFHALWDWCGVAEETNDPEGPHRFSNCLIATHTHEKESTRIKTAQLLLHHLPSPNFSL